MRLFWKALLIILPAGVGSYLLYKTRSSNSSGDTKDQEQKETNKEASSGENQGDTSQEEKKKELSTEEIIERLTKINGVTSRVAENLAERGITSKEALLKLSEEELKSIRGIGPKRADKILSLK